MDVAEAIRMKRAVREFESRPLPAESVAAIPRAGRRAWEPGIGSCLATIYEPERARDILALPADLHLRVALSFGFPADPQILVAQPRRGSRRA